MTSTRPDTPEPAADLLGDRYRLGPAIGQGRSTVYRAEDVRLQRPVAVKEVRLSIEGPGDSVGTRHRALREAQAAARLSDPHVVAVYDVLEERGAIWLVMELVDSPSLSQLVNEEGPLDPVRAARIGLDVLGALRAAHTVGVVHRDVKPANVMVVPGDRAKLTDFGVAKIRDDTQVTATGLVIGSPSYMAPEQARGERAGPAADLWALGATLYFAVEGVPPFSGGNAIAVATAVIYSLPRPPERAGPLAPLLMSLLVKEPAERPSPAEVRRQLHAAVAELRRAPTPGTAPGSPFRSRRRGRKGRAPDVPVAAEAGGGTEVFPSPAPSGLAAPPHPQPGSPAAPPVPPAPAPVVDAPISAHGLEVPSPPDVPAGDPAGPGRAPLTPDDTMATPAPAAVPVPAPAEPGRGGRRGGRVRGRRRRAAGRPVAGRGRRGGRRCRRAAADRYLRVAQRRDVAVVDDRHQLRGRRPGVGGVGRHARRRRRRAGCRPGAARGPRGRAGGRKRHRHRQPRGRGRARRRRGAPGEPG